MRLVSFGARGSTQVELGSVVGEEVVSLRLALAASKRDEGQPLDAESVIPSDMGAFLERGSIAFAEAERALAFVARSDKPLLRHRIETVTLHAPVPRPGKIIGVGRNYADHSREVGGPPQLRPRIFLKPSSSVVGPGCAVRIPAAVTKPDWEVELAVVIGRPAFEVAETDALSYVAGFTVLNDISARELQFDVSPPQTSFAKGADGFCPMGPCLVTSDEVDDPGCLDIRCWLNGSLMQEGNTRDFIFPIPALIAHVSRYMTLMPGDVIATGTPAGSGAFRKPPLWLRSGDRLRMEVEKVGVLEHSIA
jgi:2-keto-4-pentenoate hydratase/2-oxohepta-3-ene-1,7-dioic acid hydratase in catechol pathway